MYKGPNRRSLAKQTAAIVSLCDTFTWAKKVSRPTWGDVVLCVIASKKSTEKAIPVKTWRKKYKSNSCSISDFYMSRPLP